MSQSNRYRELIDACRPGSDDLGLPALAELAQAAESDRAVAEELARSQRFDLAVSTAMHDVPVPAGLLERLEAKLGEAAAEFPAADSGVALLSRESDGRVRSNRRRWWAVATALAAVVLLAVGSLFVPKPTRHVSNGELAEMSRAWFEQPLDNNAWKKLNAAPAPAAFPLPREVSGAHQWQAFRSADGHAGVVYDLTRSPLRPKARLFVIASRDKFDVRAFPYTRLNSASGGIAVAAWHVGGLLYVVVIDNHERLEHFVREKEFALALPPAARPA